MPSRDEHLRKESANAAFEAVARQHGESPEWGTTVLFYRAVHLIEAHFADLGLHHASHREHNAAVARQVPAVLPDYLDLAELSRRARYEAPGTVDWQEYEEAREAFATVDREPRPLL